MNTHWRHQLAVEASRAQAQVEFNTGSSDSAADRLFQPEADDHPLDRENDDILMPQTKPRSNAFQPQEVYEDHDANAQSQPDGSQGTNHKEQSHLKPSIPLISFTRPLGPARGDASRGTVGGQIFEPADFFDVACRLKKWFPDHDLGISEKIDSQLAEIIQSESQVRVARKAHDIASRPDATSAQQDRIAPIKREPSVPGNTTTNISASATQAGSLPVKSENDSSHSLILSAAKDPAPSTATNTLGSRAETVPATSESSQTDTIAGSSRKRKRKPSASDRPRSILLEGEVVLDPQDSGVTKSGDDWSLMLFAFAPAHVAQALNTEYRSTHINFQDRLPINPQITLFLGRMTFRRSSQATHPFAALHPSHFKQEWLQAKRCQVELANPIFKGLTNPKGAKEIPYSSATFEAVQDNHSSEYYVLNGKVHVELHLSQTALSYGLLEEEDGCIETRSQCATAFRDLIARLVRYDLPAAGTAVSSSSVDRNFTSHVELDQGWPARDFWQVHKDGKVPYYQLPDREPDLPLQSRQDVFSEHKAKSKTSSRKRKISRSSSLRRNSAGHSSRTHTATTEAVVADSEALDSGQTAQLDCQPDDTARSLPLASSIQSLLLSARPHPESPTLSPPADQILTPLYKFQQQALAWMMKQEQDVSDVIGLPLPNWIRIKVRTSSLPPTNSAKSSRNDNNSPNTISSGDTSVPGMTASASDFYLDLVSGTPSNRSFTIRRARQSGGVLADAMGLGKTVEILSLIASNPRPKEDFDDKSRSAAMIADMPLERRPFPSAATLVVAPAALMHQWATEIQKHLCNAKVVEFRSQWEVKEDPSVVRQRISEELRDATICLVSYEALSKEYQRSEASARQTRKGAISPLLEVWWYRIVLDEAQLFAAKSSSSNLSQMCGCLWRSHSWVCSSTPLRESKDLLPIFSFLDYDMFVLRNIFNEFVEGNLLLASSSPEAARQIRSLMNKLFWRNERSHVAEQLSLPPQTKTQMGVQSRGLEAAIYTREHDNIRKSLCKALGKVSPNLTPILGAVANLRQLVSHPSVASALGYSSADTFASFFSKVRNASRRDYIRQVLDGCSTVVAIDTLLKAYTHEQESFAWKYKGSMATKKSEKALKKALGEWQVRCDEVIEMQVADQQVTMEEVEALDGEDSQAGSGAPDVSSIVRHSGLTSREAKLALDKALSHTSMQDYTRRHRDRCVGLTFQQEVYFTDAVDATDANRYHPLVGDAGSMEDEMWLQAIMGKDFEDSAKREAMEKAVKAQGEGTNPIMKKRLRGKAKGHRTKDRVWAWVPKRSLAALQSELDAATQLCEASSRDLRWIENRMQEEGVALDSMQSTRDGEAEASREDRDCIICLEPPVVAGVLPCLHSACYECLCEMAKTNRNVCPYCRRKFQGVADIRQILPDRRDAAGAGGESSDGSQKLSEAEEEYGIKVATIAMDVMQRLKEDSSTKIVVFSLWRKMLNKVFEGLWKMGIECAVFAGGGSSQSDALASFGKSHAEGGKSVLLCPMKMSEGAAGLTLTMANVAFVMEPVLNVNLLAQAEGRLNRIGQTRPTTIVQMFVRGSLEEKILMIKDRRNRNHSGSMQATSSTSNAQGSEQASTDRLEASGAEADSFTVDELKFLFDVAEGDIERPEPRSRNQGHDGPGAGDGAEGAAIANEMNEHGENAIVGTA
ncbi:unnamed protein product [Sympodiomycopsis kandeliae]